VLGLFRIFEIERVDLQKRKIALALFRAADVAFNGVAGTQAEAADLRGRNVDVVRAGQIIGVGRAKEAKAVGQNLDDAFADNVGLRDREFHIRPGDTVLVQGTGGVSIFALQLAKLAGAAVIVTSSSDDKLERAKALGANHTINYRSVSEWGKAAADWAGGGVDHIVEVGGKDTLQQSIEATQVGGTILIIGVLSGFAQQIAIPSIFGKNLHVIGLSVGSRRMFENMASAIERNHMKPVVDRTVAFDAVPEALKLMQKGGHFGKIVVNFSHRLTNGRCVQPPCAKALQT
jgi:NADPH:quinone reductase-like Zn-dependent oxidoreductase